MTNEQREQLGMLYCVDSTIDEFITVVADDVVFMAGKSELGEIITDIEDTVDQQNIPLSEITKNRIAAREALVEKMQFTCNRLASYAAVTKNNEMVERYSLTQTQFKQIKDHDLESFSRRTLIEVETIGDVLVPYRLTDEFIDSLRNALALYTESVPKFRAARSNSRLATSNLASLFKRAMDLLIKRMDLDIEVYKDSNPEFYSRYTSAREMNKRNGRVSMLNCFVSDVLSKEPIKQALFTFVLESNSLKKYQKRSAEKGSLRISSMPEGIYLATVEKTGYQSKQIKVTVIKGERTVLEVELLKA